MDMFWKKVETAIAFDTDNVTFYGTKEGKQSGTGLSCWIIF